MQEQAHGLKSSSSSTTTTTTTTTTATRKQGDEITDTSKNTKKVSIVRKKSTQEGMSRSGIHDAFKDAENWDNNKKSPAIKAISTRKSSTANADVSKKKNTVNSPRLRSVATKNSNESMRSPSLRSFGTTASNNSGSHNGGIVQGRRQTLSGRSTTSNESGNDLSAAERRLQQKTLSNSSGNGLIKLADTLRDTLAVERRLAKQELGIYNTDNNKIHCDSQNSA
jgi:hypothetical protein